MSKSYISKILNLSNTDQSGNNIFYSDNKENTSGKIKNKYKSKYEEKVLVWIAISGSGMSEPYFRKSGYAIDQHVYRDECIELYLLPFIEKYHKEDYLCFGQI